MASPLIPYFQLPEISLGFLSKVPGIQAFIDPAHPPTVKPFGTLVVLGVYVGATIAAHRAAERKLDRRTMTAFVFWIGVAGFVGGHVLDALLYHPGRVARDPMYVVRLWDGLSSYGGFVGAIVGGLLFKLFRGVKILPYTDVMCHAFPGGWALGRLGCALVHDHPGRISDAWFAVRYPFGESVIGRFDLGLYECVLTVPLLIAFHVAWRRDPFRKQGFYIAALCLAYAPIRFMLDFLREDPTGFPGGDPRYAGLTPAQWACFLLFGAGIFFAIRLRNAARTDPPVVPPLPGAPASVPESAPSAAPPPEA